MCSSCEETYDREFSKGVLLETATEFTFRVNKSYVPFYMLIAYILMHSVLILHND